MQLRESLAKIDLTGPRRTFRRISTWAITGFAAIGTLGYVLPAHEIHGSWHSNYADGGPFTLVVLAIVIAAALGLRNRQLGSGMVTGLLAIVGSVVALAPVLLVHLLSHVEHGAGEGLFAIGELGLFFGGFAMLVSEPILYVLERRFRLRMRQPRLPRLPVARALA
jgi:hypothetical protein